MNSSYAPQTPAVLMPKGTALTLLGGLAAIFVLARLLLAVTPTQLALDLQAGYLAWPILVIVPVLGYIGWRLSFRIGIPDVGAGSDALRTRVITPTLLGLAVGSAWVLLDMLRPVSAATHASFPGILFLYTYAAILAEVVNRLFFATFVVWFVAIVFLRGRGLTYTYWTVAVLVTLVSAGGQAWGTYQVSGGDPGYLDLLGSFGLAAVFEPVAFYLYRRYGFLAPLLFHFAFFVVWHMLWGGLFLQVLRA